MARLKDLVEVAINNSECVILKVKENKLMELLSLGCFNGDEDMIRLTKGYDQTCTVFKKDGTHYSWHWGRGGYTLVVESMTQMGHMVQDCIEHDFGIPVRKF